uniref:Uncharacterized protein n=1 Tax=Arundo donax TaxID=35708 RepID=A0A0A8YJS0_ARUDO
MDDLRVIVHLKEMVTCQPVFTKNNHIVYKSAFSSFQYLSQYYDPGN